MNIVVITLKDGKVDITKEELEKMQNDAYDKGYRKAKNEVYTITYPTYPYVTPTCGETVTNATADHNKVTLNPDFKTTTKITC